MDWILLGLSVLLSAVSIVILMQSRNSKEAGAADGVQAIQQSLEEFVAKMEAENDQLYQKLVHYMKAEQRAAWERIQLLEEKVRVLEEERGQTAVVQKDDEEDKVLQLYKQGFSAKQIGKALLLDHGKVELMINLFNKRQISK
ncbi:hypothetical protein WQ57_06625 [Mesobacillus campisalis]|uniref:Uncharacterized protein n=1 Tax=Mesobacillus campisalis TaxID=1408103 RepID=A0A0M2SZ83_9BACI|nr:hypothetical protein [Mesobacillus campisalis]KKK39011.1 hypothetical protein WQ57_06625 [Mesobacillus campisalis]